MIKHIGFKGDGIPLYEVDGLFIESIVSGLKEGIKRNEQRRQYSLLESEIEEIDKSTESSNKFLSEIESAKNNTQ